MKKILQIFYLFLTVITVIITSCRKEPVNSVTELTIDGKQKVITVEENGIGIEFCLLNEKGEPATVFNEGESFKFHLVIKNNVKPDTAMYIVSDFLKNPNLFCVFSSNGEMTGEPVKWYGMNKVSDAINQIKLGEEWVLDIPWFETRGTEDPFDADNLIRVLQHYFMGLNQQPLSKGKYFSEFTQQFCLRKYLPHPQSEFVCTDTLKLKINFEIK